MSLIQQIRSLWKLSQAGDIARRYFVTNGFDGALTMLGILLGFYTGGAVQLVVVISACLGAAIALGISGFTSALLSETEERKKELKELEESLVAPLEESDYGKASQITPWVIAAVNGLSPFLISLFIIFPLWLESWGFMLPFEMDPFDAAIGFAFLAILFLGIFLGRISGTFWLWSGLRAVLIGLATAGIIFLIGGNG
jgi:predicted membrane protein (TIGR00267 family)